MADVIQDGWIGIEQAAQYLDVNKDTIRNWIKKSNIPAHKVGKLWKFKKRNWMNGLKVARVQIYSRNRGKHEKGEHFS